jgi:hypothetical protein
MKIYEMLDAGKISDLAEIKEFFLVMERQQIVDAVYAGMQTAPFDPNMGRAELYYNELYKND